MPKQEGLKLNPDDFWFAGPWGVGFYKPSEKEKIPWNSNSMQRKLPSETRWKIS